jgi:putative alpha-1,2-mannosidase
MSSWYVWNALGLYPAIPGVAGLAVGSPLFPAASVTLPSGAQLQILAPNASPANSYVQALEVNGAVDDSSWLPIGQVAAGGTLDFTLGTSPSMWATAAGSAPPSFGTSPASSP